MRAARSAAMISFPVSAVRRNSPRSKRSRISRSSASNCSFILSSHPFILSPNGASVGVWFGHGEWVKGNVSPDLRIHFGRFSLDADGICRSDLNSGNPKIVLVQQISRDIGAFFEFMVCRRYFGDVRNCQPNSKWTGNGAPSIAHHTTYLEIPIIPIGIV